MIHEELNMNKVVCRWFTHNLTEHQNEERIRISTETLKLLNDGSHHIISKIVTGDETCIPSFDIPTRQESKIRVFEDDPTSRMRKRQRAIYKLCMPFYSEVRDW
ncbi:uncharacterized protein TNCV_1777151 [Trichonephila clavipes]|nr:uncharacterized protein TNCV_1777151 [Trichonephila clavipes]